MGRSRISLGRQSALNQVSLRATCLGIGRLLVVFWTNFCYQGINSSMAKVLKNRYFDGDIPDSITRPKDD